MHRGHAVASALVIVALAACGRSNASGDAPARSVETLRLSSLSVRVDEATLDVSAEAWRSFQPIAGKNTDALIANVRVRSSGAPLPPSLTIDGIYLVHAGEVFATRGREEEARATGARFAELKVREGPKWAIGDSIDVVVALKANSATTYLLRAPKVVIARVD